MDEPITHDAGHAPADQPPDPAHMVADGATVATVLIGLGLTVAPALAGRVLGLSDRRVARGIGLLDLALAGPMLAGRRRSRWMAARAALNALIALVYVGEFRRSRSRRAILDAIGMSAFTLLDGVAAARLRAVERR